MSIDDVAVYKYNILDIHIYDHILGCICGHTSSKSHTKVTVRRFDEHTPTNFAVASIGMRQFFAHCKPLIPTDIVEKNSAI